MHYCYMRDSHLMNEYLLFLCKEPEVYLFFYFRNLTKKVFDVFPFPLCFFNRLARAVQNSERNAGRKHSDTRYCDIYCFFLARQKRVW